MSTWTLDQVAQHGSPEYVFRCEHEWLDLWCINRSCWVIIKNYVYDVTEFLPVRLSTRVSSPDWVQLLEGTPRRCENHTQIRRTRRHRRLRTYSSARCPREEPTLYKASWFIGHQIYSYPEWEAEKSQENKRWATSWRGSPKKTAS